MNMFRTLQGIVATAALALAANANAVPVTFDLANGPESSVSVTSVNYLWCGGSCGVTASLNPGLDSLAQTLSAGQSWWFDFFSLTFQGPSIGTGTVQASLGFDAPIGAPNANGSGSGIFASTAGFIVDATMGSLTWTSQPGAFSLVDGTSYSVFFENLSGIISGNQVNVRARLTLNSEPAVYVPEPSSTALMGVGLLALGLGLGASRRRRNKAAQF